ncbi:MAG: hypothetical protein E7316_01330 [Clostridiales bacterium]|nr:hypothetical protein [Clostridiales bacterium]
MSEEKSASRPRQLWNNALRAVRSDGTAHMMEEFTAEMTLVAEGLCEDQARLRQLVEELRRENDRAARRMASQAQALENTMKENQREADRRLDELTRRLAALEGKNIRRFRWKKNRISQLTLLAGVTGVIWLLVTVLGLFQ